MKRLPQLDGIRGVAIVLVLAWHLVCVPLHGFPLLRSVMRLGASGVDLFFVLSGMLITGILLDHRPASNYFRVFYLRRICRVLPLYFVVLILFAALTPLGGDARWRWLFDNSFPLWTYATFTQNIYMGLHHGWGAHPLAPMWSLSVEEQFYLLAPWLVRFAPRPLIGVGVAAGLVLAPLARWALPGFHTDVLTPFRLDPLLFGMALALIVRSPRLHEKLKANLRALRALLLMSIAGALVMSLLPDLFGALTYSYVGFVAALLILVVILDEQERWMRHPVLVFLGVRSYGIYLLHELVNGALHALILGGPPRLDRDGALVTLASLALTIVLATLSYRYLERPIIERGHRAAWRDVDFAEHRSLNG